MNGAGTSAKVCPECGAENISIGKSCWMCHRDLHGVTVTYRAEQGTSSVRPAFAPPESFTVLVAVASGLLVLMVGYGVATTGLASLIPFAIIAVPALLATLIRVGRKHSRGEEVGLVEMIGTFLLSGVAALGLIVSLGVAAIAGLFIYCLAGGMN